jgi:hypothetical protein
MVSSVTIFRRVTRAGALFSDCNYTGFAAFTWEYTCVITLLPLVSSTYVLGQQARFQTPAVQMRSTSGLKI